MHKIITSNQERTSVLANLRGLLPNRRLRVDEALRLAELQANRLLAARDAHEMPIPQEIVSDLPGIAVDYDLDMPASGSSDWDSRHREWVITLRASEPDTRHRFTMLHEYKHIIDHGSPGIALPADGQPNVRNPAETVADFFAACVLMPRRLVKAAYFEGVQDINVLAELFEVSPSAMRVRLGQLGLTRRCDTNANGAGADQNSRAKVVRRHGSYHPAVSANPAKLFRARSII